MSKKKKILIIIAIVSCVILAIIGQKSFSKYISQVTGNGTAEVAKWNFKVNGESEQTKSIELSSTCNDETLIDNKIAPGTEGSFDISVDGSGSDVGITYNIKFVDKNTKPTNLKFIYNQQQYDNISELENILSGTINANDENKIKVYTIKWEWPYETGNDETQIGLNDVIDTRRCTKY